MKKVTHTGFISLIGLLIGFAIIGFWLVRMYGSSTQQSDGSNPTYSESIQQAEDLKIKLEGRIE